MTVQTLLIIAGSAFGFIFLVVAFVLVFFWGKKTIKNDPSKAIIFIKNGLEIEPIKGVLTLTGKHGAKYNYGKHVVLVPHKYNVEYIRNKRAIFIGEIGQLVSSPFNERQKLSNTERETLIYELMESQIASDAVKAIKGKSGGNAIIIGIIAFIIGAVAVFGVMQMSKMMSPEQQQTPQTTQQTTTSNQTDNLPPVGEVQQ